jgi:hypothetical protein
MIHPRKFELRGRNRGHNKGEDIGSHQELAGARPEQPVAFQAGQTRGILSQQECDEGHQAENRHGNQGLLQAGNRASPVEPAPEEPGATHLEQEEKDGETGDKEAFKLFARSANGKCLRLLRIEEGAAARSPGHLVELQLLYPFAFPQPHLKPADGGDEQAQPEQAGGDLSRLRSGKTGDGKGADRCCRESKQVEQAVRLDVAFHA